MKKLTLFSFERSDPDWPARLEAALAPLCESVGSTLQVDTGTWLRAYNHIINERKFEESDVINFGAMVTAVTQHIADSCTQAPECESARIKAKRADALRVEMSLFSAWFRQAKAQLEKGNA